MRTQVEQGLLTQGTLPYNKGSKTSKEAAESMCPLAPSIRERVFSFIQMATNAMSGGLTCDQVEIYSFGSHQTVSARIRELAKDGRIKDSGKTRKTRSGRKAVVWIAS